VTSLRNRSILVVGLGTSGYSTSVALARQGANVRATDLSGSPEVLERAARLRALGVEVETGGHDLDRLDVDVAVVSPGISPDAPIVRALTEKDVKVVSEIEVAYRLARCDFLAVTGTNGKTTTTSLLAGMLAEGGVSTAAAGNIGWPLIDAIDSVEEGGAIAVEVSSFQLTGIERFRPKIAVLLNVSEDHMDWHGSLPAYAEAKARIAMNQRGDDVFVYNLEDQQAVEIARSAPARKVGFSALRGPEGSVGGGISDGFVVWRKTKILPIEDVPLPGRAGLEDTVAAATAALEYGIEQAACARAIRGFTPLAHRLEVVAVANGVTYIDDSKATNPHATLAAVQGLSDVVLIAGGRSKGIDLRSLKETVPPVNAVVAIGEAQVEIEEVFSGLVHTHRAKTMEDAVTKASGLVVAGGSVLLSPACASLDMYESYAARGEAFAHAVARLLAVKSDGIELGELP
jgi:UDP-N-acetylmuramoylalanine--D-glutamate ligase